MTFEDVDGLYGNTRFLFGQAYFDMLVRTMLAKLIPLFIFVPLVDLLIIIEVGKLIGTASTLLIIVLTGIIGATLAKFEGLRAWQKAQAELMQMRLPTNSMVDGILILIGAVLLLTPGYLTDTVGLLLLIPWTRMLFRPIITRHFKFRHFSQSANQPRSTAQVKVIESGGEDKQSYD